LSHTGAHPSGGLQPLSPNPGKPKFKKKADFVDIMISKVVRDLPFNRNHPLKSADDWDIRIL
jgi:hypothetical protein